MIALFKIALKQKYQPVSIQSQDVPYRESTFVGNHCLVMSYGSIHPKFNISKSTIQKHTYTVDKNVKRSSKNPTSAFPSDSVFTNSQSELIMCVCVYTK